PDEMVISAIRAQGAGGQHVNKVSSAVHLRYSIPDSSLLEEVKARLLAMRDRRITDEGVVIIKAQWSRSQEKNRQAALNACRRWWTAHPPLAGHVRPPARRWARSAGAWKRKRLVGK